MKYVKMGLVGLMVSMLAGIAAANERSMVIDGSTTVGPIAKAFAEHFMSVNPDVNVTVSESGSGNGAKSLVNGLCHIGMLSRFMRQGEFKECVENDVLPVAHVVALDGLPVIVHPSNPVSDLTIDQIQDIYTGRITNWKQVGGRNAPIVMISRDTNSGTYETFASLVMRRQSIAEGCEYVGSNGSMRSRVQSTPNAIGYAGIGFLDDTIKALRVGGVSPTLATVRSGEYPLARPLYMFTDGYPQMGTDLYRFITLYQTEEGQELVSDIGFVPVTQY